MSPICLFVYDRYDTTRMLLSSLLRCPECGDSVLYVFMDAARNDVDAQAVERTREVFNDLKGFREVRTFPALTNKGMSASIIEGVSKVLSEHDDVIVLEDDLILSPDFLTFMNEALEAYRHRGDIWSISGYTPQLEELGQRDPRGVFLVPRAQCWGWASWRDRWEKVDWDVSDYALIESSKERQAEFNRGGDDLYRTLRLERHHRLESWAGRWAYAGSRQHMLSVNPMFSKTQNVGMKTSKSHAGWHDSRHDVELLGHTTVVDPDVQPDEELMAAFKRHHDLDIISKIGYFMRLHNLGYDFIKGLIHRK